jgi:hypothetical protein
MRTPQAAAYLECSESFLNKDRAKGGKRLVPFRRLGRLVIYDLPELEAFKRAGRVEPKSKQHTNSDETT